MFKTVKIKWQVGIYDMRNCIAAVRQTGFFTDGSNKYSIFFNDGLSFDMSCKFNHIKKCFYGYDN